MKINKSQLETVAFKAHQYPPEDLPEIALCGRSNVGKSSFINTMLQRKNLARTSGKPGKTRTINFYRVNDELRLVDLPGYGYASAGKQERASWQRAINAYLEHRPNLVELILLVDLRHPPSALDREMYSWIVASEFAGLVIATKADKLTRNQRAKALGVVAETLGLPSRDYVIPYSATTGENRGLIWEEFQEMIRFHRGAMEE
ncbi:MAG: ribosome biogenesis GTP-binding protein YihA/YsxC [Tissierellia bacterium]|nr:ribosome biogenesis GTP-binding protein YihA/YsxC [Tissierellia bacterium]